MKFSNLVYKKSHHYFTILKPACSFNYLAFTKGCRNFASHLKTNNYVISRDNLHSLQS